MDAKLIEKAKVIRLLILDVDGILTSGHLYYGENAKEEIKGFHTRDGLGISLLQNAGIPVAFVTGRQSQAVAERVSRLHIKHYFSGADDKRPAYETLKQTLNLQDHEIACMGDDLPDLALIKRAGLSFTVPEAPAIIREHVDFITVNEGGTGAVREVCDFILQAQGKYESVIESYLL